MTDKIDLRCGDCLEVLASMPENSVDSCVTDPPYHLTSIVKRFGKEGSAPAQFGKDGAFSRASRGFMGKEWDGGDIAFRPETWAAVLRVLKPGAHITVFGGTRTFHRMTCAIEDAGFEIRDTIMWLYGSGFPKSHDVSKGIDRAAGAEREIVGRGASGKTSLMGGLAGIAGEYGHNLTKAATAAAREWEGWGTALKPAVEPIILARKPLSEKTVAANVLRYGTGAINVDGCRIWADTNKTDIGCSDGTRAENINTSSSTSKSGRMQTDLSQMDTKFTTRILTEETTRSKTSKSFQKQPTENYTEQNTQREKNGSLPGPKPQENTGHVSGRWPANVIHDGSEEVVEAFPDTPGQLAAVGPHNGAKPSVNTYGDYGPRNQFEPRDDSGSAARFFYTAKADSDDRIGSKHPTVKPLDLMQYLVRLITPKGGVVLDPFAGTGTTGEAAFREGMSAILIEREEEYQNDIRRRIALCMAGPDERRRETIKAKIAGKPLDHGPLFGGR